MALVARHREAKGAGLHAVAHQALHRRDLVISGGALLAVVIHHVVAHRGVADQVADIDPEIAVHLVEVLRHALPGEFERAQHLHRDRFDIGEELREAVLLAFAHRRQGQRAIAEDDRGRAVVAGIGAQRIPGDLRVVMAMIVDKARRDDQPRGIDRAPGRPRQFADLDDLAVLDRDVGAEGRPAGAVDNAPVLDQEVIGHRFLLVPLRSPAPRERVASEASRVRVLPQRQPSPTARCRERSPLSRGAGEGLVLNL